MLSDKTHAVYRDLKGDSGFEGFRGSEEKGLRGSGIKNKAVAKSRFKFPALAICAALMTFATTGWGQTTNTFTTAGSSNWTCPAGVTSVTVECWGGGGSGGASINGGGSPNRSGAGGGGGGAYSSSAAVTVIPGNTYAIVVGAGGPSGSSSTSGGDSSFNTSTVIAKGGAAGSSVNGSGLAGSAGSGGLASASTGTTKYSGGNGAAGTTTSTAYGGGGGSSAGTAVAGNNASTTTAGTAPAGGAAGGAGKTAAAAGDGSNASAPGGGGGGALSASSTGRLGGAGGTGQVRLTYTVAATPTITGAATATAFATTYGTASAGQSFNISGANMSAGITVTPPAGFEVSTSSTFASNVGTSASPITVGAAGTIASTPLYVRLAANAAVSGTYNSQNIVLSSTGATAVNIVTASTGNTVTAKGLTITGLTAENKNWDNTTTASVTGTAAFSGLTSGDSSLTPGGSVTWAFADANVGTNKTLDRTGIYTVSSANYTLTQPTLTASIAAVVPSAPTIGTITPGNGELSVAFTPPSSAGGASITNYKYSLNDGAYVSVGSTASPFTITGLSNGQTYAVRLLSVNSAGDGSASSPVSGTPTAPASPTVTFSGLSGTLSTTYGTASAERTFTVSGSTLSSNLTVTAPTGLEVSTTSGSGFAGSLSLTASSGVVASTPVYVRLKSTAAAGYYNSVNISITGGGDDKNVTTSSTGNTVTAKTLTITGLAFQNKVYDRTTTASATGTAALSGVESGDTANVSLGGTPVYSFSSTGVGNGIGITTTSYSISGSASGNYSLTQPSGNANITVAPLTVLGATATDRAYNALTTVAIAGGTLSGVIPGDTVTLGGSPAGTVETAAPGDGKPVTVTGFSISGTDAGNYSLSQPTGLTVNITKASQNIAGVAATVTKTFGDAPYSLGASVASGQTLSYSSDNNAVATVSSAGQVTIVGPGSANISVSQSGNGNYDAATSVTQALTVNKANQTITFGALASKLTTDVPFTLNATASSGGAVTYTSSNTGVATVLGNTVTIVGPGTTTITASSAASANYNAASVAQPLIVDLPPTTLAAGDIAVIGHNANGSPDTITFLVLKTLTPGTVFYVCDNEVASAGGTTFADTSEAEATFTVNPGQTIPAGTVVTLPWGNLAVSDSRFTWTGHTTGGLGASGTNNVNFDDGIYIYTGTSATGLTPTAFIYYVKGGSNATNAGNLPTGLSYGTTAINPTASASRYKISGAIYSGSVDQLLAATGNIATNWEAIIPGVVTDWTFSILQPQTITFGSLPAKTYGDASFNLVATASSGLSVTYVSSDTSVATVSGSAVTILKAGSTVITASQAGNSSYAAATSVPQTLTVNKAGSTISVTGTTSFTYSGNAQGPGTSSVAGSSGAVSYSYSGSGYGPTATKPTSAGSYTVTATVAADTNYNTASSSAYAFTIAMADQTITFGSLPAKTYGDAPFNLTATTTSGLAVAYVSSNTSVATVSGTSVTIVGAGSTVITASQAGNSNYNPATSADQTLTVAFAAPAGLSYSSTSINGTVGTAIASLTSTVSGSGITYSIDPALPSGLLLNPTTGEISGTPSVTSGSAIYTVTATNAGGYATTQLTIMVGYAVGPVAVADSLTKPADNEPYLIPVSQLLGNDFRITNTSGATVTTGLTVSAVTSGSGNTATLDGKFVQFTPSNGSTDTFTYTVTDGTKTATATVTITTETQAPTFTLQFVKKGTATFAGGNTVVTHDFIGVPGQVYLLEYTTDMEGAWTSAGNQNTGATGSFSVTFTKSGDVAADWNAHMFFRARLVR